MGQERKILEIIFEEPCAFTVREISKKSRVPRATVHKKLLELKKQGILNEDNSPKNNLKFKTIKINHFIEKIIDSGLIDFLKKELNPSAIILFGSFRKGESVKESDIDLFIESSIKKTLNLQKFERKLKHKIELFSYNSLKDVNKDLRNNIVNGIKLEGYLNLW